MNAYRCPMCFARDVDVVFLLHDASRDEHYCPQCAYASSAAEVAKLLEAYRAARYKERSRPHPFAVKTRDQAKSVAS